VVQQGGAAARLQRQDSSNPSTVGNEDGDTGGGNETDGEEADDSGDSTARGEPPTLSDNWLSSEWKLETYSISGETCEELQSMWRNNKAECEAETGGIDEDAAGETCYGFDFDFGSDWQIPSNGLRMPETDSGFQAEVDDVVVTLEGPSISYKERKVIMPEWGGSEDADEQLSNAWNWFVHELRTHELAHVKTTEQWRDKILERLEATAEDWESETGNDIQTAVEEMTAKERGTLQTNLSDTIEGKLEAAENKLEGNLDDTFQTTLDELMSAQETVHDQSDIDEAETLDCSQGVMFRRKGAVYPAGSHLSTVVTWT